MTEDELYVIEANIVRYKRLLKSVLDDETRSIARKLLAEAEEVLEMEITDRH